MAVVNTVLPRSSEAENLYSYFTLLSPFRRFVEFVVLVLAALGSLVGPAAAEEQYRAASLNLVEKVNAPPKEVRSSLRCYVDTLLLFVF
jgi:hypothetical protein